VYVKNQDYVQLHAKRLNASCDPRHRTLVFKQQIDRKQHGVYSRARPLFS
jgi:hypothetical protein